MVWWLQLIVLWISLDVVIISTGWYAIKTIKPYFPKWWERHIAVDLDKNYAIYFP